MSKKTLKELTNLIIEWGVDKGIYEKSSYEYQLNKTLEEITELHKAILDDDVEQIKDAIGDIYVTLVMAGQFAGYIKEQLKEYYDKKKLEDFSIDTQEIEFKHLYQGFSYIMIDDSFAKIHWILESLQNISITNNFFLRDAVEHSYNIISKRAGKMIDGVFVKND